IIVIRGKDYTLYKKTYERIMSRAKYLSSPSSILHIFLDVIVDNLLIEIDKLDDEIGMIESKVLKQEENVLEDIYVLKDKIITLRRLLLPMKEVVYGLSKHSKFISSKQVMYFRDIYEHLVVAINQLDLFRDATTNLIDLTLSLSQQKLNENMKILTAITTIFLPLTLITGIYGMNFKHMPELGHPYGYYFTLIAMFIIGSVLFYIFKKKKFI
ncbi:MAG: magnesium transporter CorA family protein, partial [Candidatus Nanohaloarchaeota archaeon]|nr:magnesium transporter CorA family protein [Candidatus Nanohaloarchaeota archaeon]